MKHSSSIEKDRLSDTELVFLIKSGDTTAFSLLSDRYMPAVSNRAARYSNIAGVDLDDFVQEGMLALFRAAQGFSIDGGAKFGTYAITCINNSMTDAIRSHMKTLRNSGPSVDDLERHRVQTVSSSRPLEDLYMDREESTARAQQIEILLSDFEQQVLKLYLRGHTYQQISSILSTAPKAVDNALQRVRKKLRPDF